MKSLKAVGPLFSQCACLAQQNKRLFLPCFQMALINLVVFACLLMGLFGLAFRQDATLHFLGMTVIVMIVLFPIRAFLRVRFMAVESLMIYETLHAHKILSTGAAWKATAHHTFSYLLLMLTDALAAFIKKLERRDHPGLLSNLTGATALEQAVDMATYYAIPLIVLENLSFRAALLRAKDLWTHAGASIGGVLGIDALQFVFRLLLSILIVILGGIGCLLGFLGTTMHGSFSWMPLAIALVILFVAHAFLKPFFDLLKMLYFTSLYHAASLPPTKNPVAAA